MPGPIRIAILANGKQARAEADLTARAYTGMGKTIAKGGALLGVAGLAKGIVGLGKTSIATEAQFSQRMNLLAAATKAPAAEIRSLNDLAIKLGAETSFSANEAADAMLELGRAGQTSAQITASVPEVLNLAATEGIALADAAGIVTSGLAQFQMGADEAGVVVNALAGASNASRSSVASLGESFKLVGSAADGIGLSVEETAGALAALSQSGLDGSVAGTSLAGIFNRLIPTTERARTAMNLLDLSFVNADGSFKGIDEIAQDLQDSLGGLSDAQRKVRIQDMFGNDASTIAAVNALIKAGGDGLRDYTEAAKDTDAALDLAKARMKGTSGVLELMSGVVETAQLRIGQELAPAVEKAGDILGDNLLPALDAGIDAAKEFGNAVEPAVTAVIDVLDDLIPSGDAARDMFNDTLIPTLRTLSEITADVVGVIDSLPGGVKEVALQAGIAAMVLPRLTGAATAAGTSMRNASIYAQVLALELRDTNSRAQLARNAMTKLGGAARAAAGVGGMVALTQGASQSNEQVGKLMTLLGGAGTGFSVGGPVGAVLGLVASGAFIKLSDHVDDNSQSFREAYGAAGDYAASLDKVSGALTAVTKAEVSKKLQDEGAFNLARQLGISHRDVTRAVLGNEGAIERVTTALNKQSGVSAFGVDALGRHVMTQGALAGEAAELTNIIGIETDALEKNQAETRELAIASDELKRSMEGIRGATREKIVSRIETQGWPESERQIARVIRGMNLTPKQIRTVLRTLNADQSVADIQRVLAQMDRADRRRARPRVEVDTKGANLTGWAKTFMRDISTAEGRAQRGGEGVRKGVEAGPKRAKPDFSLFLGGVQSGTDRATSIGSSGGSNAGSALGSGMYFGLNSWAGPIADRAASIVRQAVTAAENAGEIRSPSRVTMWLGEMLGIGFALGIEGMAARNQKAGRDTVRGMLAGVVQGSEGVERSLEAVDKHVERAFDESLKKQKKRIRLDLREREKHLRGKLKGRELDRALSKARKAADRDENAAEKINSKARRKATRDLRSHRAALLANGRAQDANAAALENAEAAYQAATEAATAYSDAVKQGFLDYGSISALGSGDGFANADQMLAQLRARVERAEQYAEMIRQLRAAGLNDTTLQQLIDAGVEGGFGTAQTLLTGGAGVIAEFNSLTAQLGAAGGSLGNEMAQHFHGAGIQAAAGLVAGLKAQQHELDKAAVQMANALAKAVKKALGIKSPSRIFMGIGDNVTRGLTLGLDDTYVKRAGARLAGSLETGFGSPSLSTYASTAAATSAAAGAKATFIVQVPPTADKAAIGREIASALDAWVAVGGRVG